MVFIEERKLKEACHCSHSLVFKGGRKALNFCLVPFATVNMPDEEFYHEILGQYSATDGHLQTKRVTTVDSMLQMSLRFNILQKFLEQFLNC